VADHEWADDVVALTLTFVRGLGLGEVGDLLGLRWDTERPATFTDAEWQQDHETSTYAVQAAPLGGWIVLVEPNGYLTSLPRVVAALSRRGVAVSVFWNVNALMRLTAARDGAVVRAFDPLLFAASAEGEPLPQEEGLPFGEVGPVRQAALELAERLTGVHVDRTWLLEIPRSTWTTTGPATA
jgi:DMSO/TMAO reductase YedYZ molybdopterin-dependent catalytic subunit